jgi:hypothetical protein
VEKVPPVQPSNQQVQLQNTLVELRKRERLLLQQASQHETTISDLKRQVKRSNEISRELIEKVKDRELPISRLTMERDEAL